MMLLTTKIKKRLIGIVLLFIVGGLIIPGCNLSGVMAPSWRAYTHYPAVTSSDSGEAIVVYEVVKANQKVDFYAQKLSPDGEGLWGGKGVRIGGGAQFMLRGTISRPGSLPLQIASDGSGGAVVLWNLPDEPRLSEYSRYRLKRYITRIGPEGQVMWTRELSLSASDRDETGHVEMICNGSGGAIIVWSDLNSHIYAREISSKGEEKEVHELGKADCMNCFDVAAERSGSTFIVWENDVRSGEGRESSRVRVQKMASTGDLVWREGGLPVANVTGHPEVVSDGSGGCIIVSPHYAQRIDGEGHPVWQEAVPVIQGVGPFIVLSGVVPDGLGGAVIAWMGSSPMSDYAQRLDSEGKLRWPGDGVQIKGNYASEDALQMVSDDSGGIITFWGYEGDQLRIQRINGSGESLWPEDGVALFSVEETRVESGLGFLAPVMQKDGEGGAFIVRLEDSLSYIQHVNADGDKVWGEDGILLTP